MHISKATIYFTIDRDFVRKIAITSLLICVFNFVFAQAPIISYQTPQKYAVNNPIVPLVPVNTGGSVSIIGQVKTIAGSPTTSLIFAGATSIAEDDSQNLYVVSADNNQIIKVSPNGNTSLFAGSPSFRSGTADGQGINALFAHPYSIVKKPDGGFYVADQEGNRIRKVTDDAVVSTFAGTGVSGAVNGRGNVATFNSLTGMVLDAAGNIYVTDQYNNLIRKFPRPEWYQHSLEVVNRVVPMVRLVSHH